MLQLIYEYNPNGNTLIATVDTPLPLNRENMALTSEEVELRLGQLGLLAVVKDYIDSLPVDHKLRIRYYRNTTFRRLDPDVIDFCKNFLGWTDEQIDTFFTSS